MANETFTVGKPFCSTPPRVRAELTSAVRADPRRAAAILVSGSKWLNKTVLHYCFFESGHYTVPDDQADAIRDAFRIWKAVGIGLNFVEVAKLSEAEVRIGFSLEDGRSESYVGRDILRAGSAVPTTIYGWDLTSPYGRGTALHEIGHVLGMQHEHQSSNAGIKWHEDEVYAALKRSNGWSREETYRNILRKLDPGEVDSSRWDPDSIMQYEFEAGLIDEPEEYDLHGLRPPGTLSNTDKLWALKWYPGDARPETPLEPFKSATVNLGATEQADFVIQPTESRKYTIATKGACDTLLVLFEQIDGEPRYLTADDDSGEDRNASISYKLFQGRTYIVRLRVNYPGQTGMTSLLVI